MQLSIIIPTYNEQHNIGRLLALLAPLQQNDCELIVVDGGSTDDTIAQAANADIVLQSAPGRAVQMNAGAEAASGTYLWFVHADTGLLTKPELYMQYILQSGGWGFFPVKLDDRHVAFRLIEFMMNKRSALFGIGTGDQGIFVSKKMFEDIGKYLAIALMEDVALSTVLNKKVKPNVPSILLLCTSARRWRQHGIVNTVLLMWWLRLQYFCGVSPQRLAEKYRRAA